MIDRQTVARIRQLYYAEHWTVGTIAAELGLHHETVENALHEKTRANSAPRPSLLDAYLDFIRQVLENYPRLTATRIFAMLKQRGYSGKERQVRRTVAKLRPPRREPFLRRRTFAGEEGLCGIPHRPSYAAPGNMRRPPKATALVAAPTAADAT